MNDNRPAIGRAEWAVHMVSLGVGTANYLAHLPGKRLLSWPDSAALDKLPSQPSVEDMLAIPRHAPCAGGFQELMLVIMVQSALVTTMLCIIPLRLLQVRASLAVWQTFLVFLPVHALSTLYWFGEKAVVWRDEGR